MSKSNKIMIQVCLCGAGTKKAQAPTVPYTADELAEQIVACAKAGASIAHIHVREDKVVDGEMQIGYKSMSLQKFTEAVEKTRELCAKVNVDIIINLTTSGGEYEDQKRLQHLAALHPEMCSFDPNTLNWSNSYIFENSPRFLNKLAAEVAAMETDEEKEAEAEEKKESGKAFGELAPDVRRSLWLILFSVAFWFMGYNAVTSAFSKYATTVWGVSEGAAANCLLVATVGAIVSYWPVGQLSSKIGRKKMILCGVTLLAACFLVSGLMKEMTVLMYVGFALVGLAWASINVNSFPMVVELAQGSDTGKYTGYYYTFSMAAQTLTPILSGYLLEHVGYHTLFPYAAGMVALSFVTMCFVHHGDSKPAPKKGLEALDVDD